MILGCTNYKPDKTGCDRMMSHDYYLRWKTEGFEEDVSVDKPSYIRQTEPQMPSIINSKNKEPAVERKKADVHKVEHIEHFIEKDGFSVVVDNDGVLITDMDLLHYLRELRAKTAKKEAVPAYAIIKNNGLVSLATYRPATKEEFTSLYGLGEIAYNKYGQLFITAIKEYSKIK